MKHGVVVASPRAGITRDKYSANKSSHPPPSPPSLAVTLLSPCYLQNVARGWSVRGRRQFLTSRAVYRRWPPTSMPGGGWQRQGAHSMYSMRVLFRATCARARARICALSFSFSLILFSRFPFFALVLRYRSIFFAFFGRRWIARQLPIRII